MACFHSVATTLTLRPFGEEHSMADKRAGFLPRKRIEWKAVAHFFGKFQAECGNDAYAVMGGMGG